MNNRGRLLRATTYCVAVVSMVTWLVAGAQAGVVIDYTGGDPIAAGWSLTSGSACSATLVDDAGTAALKIIDPSTASGQTWSYRWAAPLTSQQVTDITDVGFSVSANLRVEDMATDDFDETPAIAPGIMVALQDLGVWYVLALGQDANGDTTYTVKGGYNLATEISGTITGSGYHDYDLRYSSYAGSADLFVDGIEVVSDLASSTNIAGALGNRVRWGAEDSPGIGTGYWTSIALETAPATITPETLPTILTHSGSTDPTDEGWAYTAINGTGTTVGAFDDGGTAVWKTADTQSVSSSGSSKYYDAAAAVDLTNAATDGFAFKATLRVEDTIAAGYDESTATAPGMLVRLEEAGLFLLVGFGLDENGDTSYFLKDYGTDSENASNGWGITEGVASGSGYHDFELYYDGETGLIDLWVDGVAEIIDHEARTSTVFTGNRIQWGSLDSIGVGEGYWENVTFEVSPEIPDTPAVPEPSTLVLLLMAAGSLVALRRAR